MATTKKITETGPEAIKGVRNPDLYASKSLGLSSIEKEHLDNIIKKADQSYYNSSHGYVGYQGLRDPSLYSPQVNQGLNYGSSSYDQGLMVDANQGDIQDKRAASQSGLLQLTNGLAKGAILAGTTFLDGTLGLLFGTGAAIGEGRGSALWDNDFSRAMLSINEWSEEAMPNYYSQNELNDPWYEHIISANFIGDKFIKNLGFTIGAFYSGGVEAFAMKGLGRLGMITAKSLGAANKTIKSIAKTSSHVASAVGAITSAVNEGRIEALNNSKEWYEATLAPIRDEYTAKREELMEKGDYGAVQLLDKNYQETLAKLNEDRLHMGNMDLIMNLPILTMSNIIQFGKMYANGFRTGRRANNILGNIEKGYRKGTTKAGVTARAFLNPFSEGLEEISQSAASRISGDYYETDVNNFYNAKFHPEVLQQLLSWQKAFMQGINETVNEGSSWEEFFIGTFTGALGMPRFRSAKNSLGKWRSPVTLEGGIWGEYKEGIKRMEREQRIADYLNNRIQDPKFKSYYQGLTRHRYYQNDMDRAAEEGNEFEFKNAELAQFISDIAMFDAAGKIGDLTTLINSAFDVSDENLESIVKNTTSVKTALELVELINDVLLTVKATAAEAAEAGDQETLDWANNKIQELTEALANVKDVYIGPFTNENGSPLYATEKGKQEMIDKLTLTKDEMLSQIDEYIEVKLDLLDSLPESIGDDQLEELIFFLSLINNWDKRGELMTPKIQGILREAAISLLTLADAAKAQGNEEAHKDLSESVRSLNELIEGKTPKQLMLMLSNPKNENMVNTLMGTIALFGDDVIENQDKKTVLQMLEDIIKIGLSKQVFRDRLKQYIENPSEQARVHEEEKKLLENALEFDNRTARVDNLRNASINDLIDELDDFDEEDFEDLEDILNDEEDEIRDRVNEARKIIDKADKAKKELDNLLNSGLITELEYKDALAKLESSKKVAENVDDFQDLETEVFNSFDDLDDEDLKNEISKRLEEGDLSEEEAKEAYETLMEARNDRVKGVLRRVFDLSTEEEERLEIIPGAAPTIDDSGSEDETGHDAVSKNTPVNAPTVPDTSLKALAKRLTDMTLEKLGHSRKTNPLLSQDFDFIYQAIARGVEKGVSYSDIKESLFKTTTYKRLKSQGYPMDNLIARSFMLLKDGKIEDTTKKEETSTEVELSASDQSNTLEVLIDEENKRNLHQINSEAYLEENRKEGTSTSMGKLGGLYDYWKTTTALFLFGSRRGEHIPYWQTVTTEAKLRLKAIYEFLKDKGAFSRVNSNKVKKGDEVHFGISKELTEKAGVPVILILDSEGNVIGDLPVPADSSFNNYPGLSQFYAGAVEWYLNNKDTIHNEGKDIAVIPGYKSNVAKNMVGRPLYTAKNERKTLNQIHTVTTSDGTKKRVPFKLGVAIGSEKSSRVRIMADPGRSKSQGASAMERTIISPLRAVKGLPFLLMPTSSGTRAFMPVPITMPRFDWSNPTIANSALGQEILKKIQELSTIADNDDVIGKWKIALLELLYVPEIHVNFITGKDGKPSLKITIKKEGETKQTTVYEGSQDGNIEEAVLKGLSGTMFQVSRKYINDTYNGRDYNEMIGELAETNLPEGATHTINDWFTIDPIVDKKQRKAHSPKSTKVNPNQTDSKVTRIKDSKGNIYYLTASNDLYKENAEGQDILITDSRFNYMKAYAYGYRIGETMTKSYDTPWGHFNPLTFKFEPKNAPEKAPSASGSDIDSIRETSSKISFNAKDHSYTVNGQPVDMSVTQWVHRNDPPIEEETEGILGYLEISSKIGTEVDAIARAFFEGRIYNSSMFTSKLNKEIRKEMQKLKNSLDEEFGKGKWKPITDESMLRVAGVIQTAEGPKTVAGTMDMLIQDELGNFHIIDFKTKRTRQPGVTQDIAGSQKAGYDTLVSMYAALLQANNPSLKGKIGKSFLATFNVHYQAPRGGRSNETGKVVYRKKRVHIYARPVEGGKEVRLNASEGFNPGTFNKLQEVKEDRTLPAVSAIGSTTQKQLSSKTRNSLASAKKETDKSKNTVKSTVDTFTEDTLSDDDKGSESDDDFDEDDIGEDDIDFNEDDLNDDDKELSDEEIIEEQGPLLFLDALKQRIPITSASNLRQALELLSLLDQWESLCKKILSDDKLYDSFIKTLTSVISQDNSMPSILKEKIKDYIKGTITGTTLLQYILMERDSLELYNHIKDLLSRFPQKAKGSSIMEVINNLKEHWQEDFEELLNTLVNTQSSDLLSSFFTKKMLDSLSKDTDLSEETKSRLKELFEGKTVDAVISKEDALTELKKKGLLSRKERATALNKITEDRLAKLIGMSKLKAKQLLDRFDARRKPRMSDEDLNDLFDSIMDSKPLPREVELQILQDKQWSVEKEIKKLRKILPQLSEEGRVRLVKALIRIQEGENSSFAWGKFLDGIITLFDKAARGTAYHEAFHFVSQALLSPLELEDLYLDARKHYGKFKRLELEEELAEDFRRFMLSYEDGNFFLNLFRTLKHIIKSIFGKETVTNKLFHDIRRGRLASRTINRNEESLGKTKEEQALYREAEANIQNSLKAMRTETLRFLDNFGITIRDVDSYKGDLPLFDALDRVINVRSAEDLSEGVGYAVAFMMQNRAEMKNLFKYKSSFVPKNIRRSLRNRGDVNALGSLKHLDPLVKQQYLKEIGSEIAQELRKLYNLEPINVEPKSFLAQLWSIIIDFFDMLTPLARTKFNVIRNYTRNIANSIKINDKTIIKYTDVKPGTTEKATRVHLSEAFANNPYEVGIIELLNSYGIALGGSASIALEGTLYRPSENPLHDIDFDAGTNTQKDIETMIKKHFPHNTFIREIAGERKGDNTYTYLIMDRPFTSKEILILDEKGKIKVITELYDKETGELLGNWIKSELTLKEGVLGKFLDFFTHEKGPLFPSKVFKINGKSYLISDYRNAMDAKVRWARPKDIWDYNNFIPNRFVPQKTKKDIRELILKARIIWGHPAIGKTTYLESHQDILEWDQEVNPKRNAFIRDQIDPEHKMDIESEEYKELKRKYMGEEWRTHPEYIEFLTREWEVLKLRASRENKRLFASPSPLLEIARDDFDLFVNLPEKEFLERNQERKGSYYGSLLWKQTINDLLTKVDQDKLITTELYFSEFMKEHYADNYGTKEIELYHRDKLEYGRLDLEQKNYMAEKGISIEEYNSMTPEEKEVLLKCM